MASVRRGVPVFSPGTLDGDLPANYIATAASAHRGGVPQPAPPPLSARSRSSSLGSACGDGVNIARNPFAPIKRHTKTAKHPKKASSQAAADAPHASVNRQPQVVFETQAVPPTPFHSGPGTRRDGERKSSAFAASTQDVPMTPIFTATATGVPFATTFASDPNVAVAPPSASAFPAFPFATASIGAAQRAVPTSDGSQQWQQQRLGSFGELPTFAMPASAAAVPASPVNPFAVPSRTSGERSKKAFVKKRVIIGAASPALRGKEPASSNGSAPGAGAARGMQAAATGSSSGAPRTSSSAARAPSAGASPAKPRDRPSAPRSPTSGVGEPRSWAFADHGADDLFSPHNTAKERGGPDISRFSHQNEEEDARAASRAHRTSMSSSTPSSSSSSSLSSSSQSSSDESYDSAPRQQFQRGPSNAAPAAAAATPPRFSMGAAGPAFVSKKPVAGRRKPPVRPADAAPSRAAAASVPQTVPYQFSTGPPTVPAFTAPFSVGASNLFGASATQQQPTVSAFTAPFGTGSSNLFGASATQQPHFQPPLFGAAPAQPVFQVGLPPVFGGPQLPRFPASPPPFAAGAPQFTSFGAAAPTFTPPFAPQFGAQASSFTPAGLFGAALPRAAQTQAPSFGRPATAPASPFGVFAPLPPAAPTFAPASPAAPMFSSGQGGGSSKPPKSKRPATSAAGAASAGINASATAASGSRAANPSSQAFAPAFGTAPPTASPQTKVPASKAPGSGDDSVEALRAKLQSMMRGASSSASSGSPFRSTGPASPGSVPTFAPAGFAASPASPSARLASAKADAARLLAAAKVLYTEGSYAGAHAKFSEALAKEPDNAIALCNRAAASMMLGDHEAAVSDAEGALRLDAGYLSAMMRACRAYLALGQPGKARETLDRAHALHAAGKLSGSPASMTEAWRLRVEMRAYLDAEDDAGRCVGRSAGKMAIEALDRGAAAFPAGAPSLSGAVLRARAHLLLADHRKVVALCTSLLPSRLHGSCDAADARASSPPEMLRLAVLYAGAAWALEETATAERVLEATLRVAPGHAEAAGLQKVVAACEGARKRGNGHYKEARYEEAITCYSAALRGTEPTGGVSTLTGPLAGLVHNRAFRATVLANRAAANSALGRHRMCVSDCSLALTEQPAHTKARLRRARAFVELKEWGAAIADFKEALALVRAGQPLAGVSGRTDAAAADIQKELNRASEGKREQEEERERAERRRREQQQHQYRRGFYRGEEEDDDDPYEEDDGDFEDFFFHRSGGGSGRHHHGGARTHHPPAPPPRAPPDHYAVLEIAITATESDVRLAYRKRALVTHPDKGGDEEEFKRCVTAYETLLDAPKRREYDAEVAAFKRRYPAEAAKAFGGSGAAKATKPAAASAGPGSAGASATNPAYGSARPASAGYTARNPAAPASGGSSTPRYR